MDRELKIKISTPADTSGAKQTAAALQEATKAVQNNSPVVSENAKKTEFLGLKMGELRKITRELSREFPLAGTAARLMLNPIAATFTVAIGLFAAAKEKLADWNKELDATAEKLAEPTFQAAIDARREALNKGAEAADKFADHMAHLTTAEELYAAAMQTSRELLKELNAARSAAEDAKYGFNADELKRELELGLISQAQYFQALIALEKNHEQQKLAREKAARAQELQDLQDEAAAYAAAAEARSKQAKADRSGATSAGSKADADAAVLKSLEETLPEAKKKADELLKKIEAKYTGFGTAHFLTGRGTGLDELKAQAAMGVRGAKERLEEYNAAVSARDQTASGIAKLRGVVPAEQRAAARAESQAGRSEGEAAEDARKVEDLQRQIEALKRKNSIADSAGDEAAAAALHKTLNAAELGGGFKGGDIETAARLENFRDTGHQLTDIQKQWLTSFEEFAKTHGDTYLVLLKSVRMILAHAHTQKEETEALKREVDQLLSRSNTPPVK